MIFNFRLKTICRILNKFILYRSIWKIAFDSQTPKKRYVDPGALLEQFRALMENFRVLKATLMENFRVLKSDYPI